MSDLISMILIVADWQGKTHGSLLYDALVHDGNEAGFSLYKLFIFGSLKMGRGIYIN